MERETLHGDWEPLIPLKRKEIPLKEISTQADLDLNNNLREQLLLGRNRGNNDIVAKLFDRTIRLEFHLKNHPHDLKAALFHQKLKYTLYAHSFQRGIEYPKFNALYELYKNFLMAKELQPKQNLL